MRGTSQAVPDAPASPSPAARPRSVGLLLVIALLLVGLSVVFGVTTIRSHTAFREYKERTLQQQPPPWTQRSMSVPQCVQFTIDWAMDCPSMESWCGNEAPRLTAACLASADRTDYCQEVGDTVASTRFGVHECEALRQDITAKYAKRSHKKYCAAAYRAVAEHCRRQGGEGGLSPGPSAP